MFLTMASNDFEKFIDKEILLSSVANRSVLWDKTLDSYKDKNAKTAAWREIFVILKDYFEVMEQRKRQVR